MLNQETRSRAPEHAPSEKSGPSAPVITLPKGGGAIRGMGEKFAANPVTGTGSMTVPIAISPGRSGFGPQLALSYDSGAGNGPFGFGWSLSLPSITRKTDKGLPLYRDAEESDVFILSGAEDLVPVFKKDPNGNWLPDPIGNLVFDEVGRDGYLIRRYRPRIEGLFARIERWTRVSDPSDVHWRSLSKDNILTVYGSAPDSRIFDPADPSRIFSWLICETRDDKGNAIIYRYKAEDGVGVDLSRANERNRGARDDVRRTANRYLKHIQYGNSVSLLDTVGHRPRDLTQDQIAGAGWMFEVVFDYEDHSPANPKPDDDTQPDDAGEMMWKWSYRSDPFSFYRAGFEVRTTRICKRVLMFHHFPNEPGVGSDCLVRSTELTYSHVQDPASVASPVYAFLRQVTQSAYLRNTVGYDKRNLPPIEFEYTQPIVRDEVLEVDAESLENLPIGLDGTAYQWTDLYGEGIPGILTEQADAWFYKRNLSPIGKPPVEFAPLESVATKPNLALAGGFVQFMDLAGDGQIDLVVLDGPMPGLYENDGDEGWQSFRPFTSHLHRDMRDPNLKFVDLDGDGHTDVLLTEDGAFTWHTSLQEAGFGPAQRMPHALDEEQAPRLVFADGTQSIYLADLSGDGLTDLVRIRNGEICYWSNVGYGRFGAKVTMDNAPYFDHPDQFDQKRIRLADIDGSGTTDLIYLHRDGVRLYFNQSGNGWSAPVLLRAFPRVDEVVSIVPTDLLGNGTACLVWSSPLPGDARGPMRYIDLMGGQKPHLLIKTVNNLGAETHVQYAPSTKYYLQDKRDGTPWITKLPFPVHCVEKVTVTDKWRMTSFSTSYTYHHGFFDGFEREFRGFGRVEQLDTEAYRDFVANNAASPHVSDDKTLYQPPIKTVTWYHTGFAFERDHILSAFEKEYYAVPGFSEHKLPEPIVGSDDLTADEWREQARACKGMVLRQEVFELDQDALELGQHLPVRLFSTAYHNSVIHRVQLQGSNRHAVFLATESEAITHNFELDLQQSPVTPDPRIAHTLNLRIDEYGNVLEAVAAVYSRSGRYANAALAAEEIALIQHVQNDEHHLTLSCTRYTEDIIEPDTYRLRIPCQTQVWDVTGVFPTGTYFTLTELISQNLAGRGAQEISYHELANGTMSQKRLVECARTLFFAQDLIHHRNFGLQGRLALVYESYKLALTKDLLDRVLVEPARLTRAYAALNAQRNHYPSSGYYNGDRLFPNDPITPSPLVEQYWVASGQAGFNTDAPRHFYLPERYTDPFGNPTLLAYDANYGLFIQSSTDARGNTTRVEQFDYRMLAPREMVDLNGNYSEVYFDILGMVVALAAKGKQINGQWEGDNLGDYNDALANPSAAETASFCTASTLDEAQARSWLGNASARFVYHFGERITTSGERVWNDRMPGACGIVRERHASQVLLDPLHDNPLQATLECSDGNGNVLMKKAQAEPDPASGETRWLVNGLTVLNNKGKPVKQYEPRYSAEFGCELPQANGVSITTYSDAAGRVVRVDMPDGSYTRVEFSPWEVLSYDANDTAYDADPAKRSDWYNRRTEPTHPRFAEFDNAADRRAATLVEKDANTPAATFLDSLGRNVVSMAHNRYEDGQGGLHDDRYLTYTKLDAEGKPLWIRDPHGHLVMQYIAPAKANNDPAETMPAGSVPCYDIAGNLLFQHSMDAGDRWMIMDAAGKPMLAWDLNETGQGNPVGVQERVFSTDYDALHRATALWFVRGAAPRIMVERYEYQDAQVNDTNNLNGQLLRHYDPSGLMETVRRDFKGNVAQVQRTLNNKPEQSVIDWQRNPSAELANETYIQTTEYDALNRMTQQLNWHLPGATSAAYKPTYSLRGLLASETLTLHRVETTAIETLRYNVKNQKEYLVLANGTITQFTYDPETFRLTNIRTTRPLPSDDQCSAAFNDATIIQDLVYTYDAVGNITQIRDVAQATRYGANQQIAPVQRYAYDALYRLIYATGRENGALAGAPTDNEGAPLATNCPAPDPSATRNYTERYEYDSVGNIIQMEHDAGNGSWTRHYRYAFDDPTQPTSNRLWQTWLGSTATDTITYQHDTHGNMLNLARVAPAKYMQWDYRDMMGSMDLGGGGTALYQYDAGKQRTRKRVANQNGLGGYWERIYLGGYERYRRYNSSRMLVEEIESFHLFEGEQRVLLVEDVVTASGTGNPRPDHLSVKRQTLFRYQYSNHLGSACLELDDQAEIISYEEYHPYGTSAFRAMKNGIEAPPKRYRYTGMERDEESGLNYHGARYYAAWLGRWCSSDSSGIRDGVDLYQYVLGNPLKLVDLDGTSAWNTFLGGVKAVGGGFEVAAGVALVAAGVATSGIGIGVVIAAAGVLVAAHGADTVVSGVRTALAGEEVDTFTSQGLQRAGMSRTAANLTDAGISIVGTLGASSAASALRGITAAAAPSVAAVITEAAPAVTRAAPGVARALPAVARAAPAATRTASTAAAAAAPTAATLPIRAVPTYSASRSTLAAVEANIEPVQAAIWSLGEGVNGIAHAWFLPRAGVLGRLGIPRSARVAIQVLDNPEGSTLARVTAHEIQHATDFISNPVLSWWATTSWAPGRGIGNFIFEARGYLAEGEGVGRAFDSMSVGAKTMFWGEVGSIIAGGEIGAARLYYGSSESTDPIPAPNPNDRRARAR